MEHVITAGAVALALPVLFVSAALLRSGFVHLTSRSDVIRDAQAHSPKNPRKVMRGEVDAYKRNGRRDASIAAGIARDRADDSLVLQGRVSDEVLETIV